jgi:hypothetical protein
MKTWHMLCMGLLAALMGSPRLWGQVPAVPAAPAGAAAAAAAAAPAAAGAAGEATKGFAFVRKFQEQCDICKRKICATPLGEFINNMTMPLSALSGGLIPPCCPTAPSAEELAGAADDPGPLGAAAQVAADEAAAKKRRAAVRYMSTVDCHWWPEVEKALIIALRTDRNECVRLEAAKGLGHGCCCTRKVIEALAITVEGSSRDGNPSENSERVRACALLALNHCLCCYRSPAEPVEGEEKEKPQPLPAAVQGQVAAVKSGLQLSAYYQTVEKKPMADVVARARKVAAAASGSGPLAPRPTETCLRDILFPSMAASANATPVSGTPEGTVVNAGATTVVPMGTPVSTVIEEPAPATPMRRPLMRLWGNPTPAPEVPMEITPVPVITEPLKPVPVTPIPTTPISKAPVNPYPAVKPTAVTAPVIVGMTRTEPAMTPVIQPAQPMPAAKPTPTLPGSTGIVQAGHRVVTTTPVEGPEVLLAPPAGSAAPPTTTVKTEPVPITDLLGPNSRAVLRGQPVVEKSSTTPAAPPAPIVAASGPGTVVPQIPAPAVKPVGTTPAPAPKGPGFLGGLSLPGRGNDPARGPDTGKLLRVLQSDSNATARRKAAEELEQQNLQSCREAVPVLLHSACADSDADVRVRCIRCLLQTNPTDAQLRTLVDRLQTDADGEVQFQLYLVRQRLDRSTQPGRGNKG